jgi:hypothetical protein
MDYPPGTIEAIDVGAGHRADRASAHRGRGHPYDDDTHRQIPLSIFRCGIDVIPSRVSNRHSKRARVHPPLNAFREVSA